MEIRKNIRLKGYDYSANGMYFITFCTKDRHQILSKVVGGDALDAPNVVLSKYGEITEKFILSTNLKYKHIKIENYVIMPNHIHLIINIKENINKRSIRESTLRKRSEISKIVGYLKMNASKKIRLIYKDKQVWQRSYYDHIIRNEEDYKAIYQYITQNPLLWCDDCYYKN